MADVFTLAQGEFGVKWMPLALVSAIAVYEGGRVGKGMVGLQLCHCTKEELAVNDQPVCDL